MNVFLDPVDVRITRLESKAIEARNARRCAIARKQITCPTEPTTYGSAASVGERTGRFIPFEEMP